MTPEEFIEGLNENDRLKMIALMRSFATPDDLQAFIVTCQETHREQERRRWAWDLIKKVAAAIVLIGAAVAAVKNLALTEWFTPKQ